MTHDELARRRPVWSAMSDLFLDTEVRWNVPHVARVCAESGYDDEALERIFWAEVFPEAIPNMLGVAGEWAILELNEAALIRRANHPSIPWLTRRAHGGMVDTEWLAAREVTKWLRPLEAADRARCLKVLNVLGRRYFEEPASPIDDVWAKELVSEPGLAREEWARYEPLCRAMRVEGDTTHEACSNAVARLLDATAPRGARSL